MWALTSDTRSQRKPIQESDDHIGILTALVRVIRGFHLNLGGAL